MCIYTCKRTCIQVSARVYSPLVLKVQSAYVLPKVFLPFSHTVATPWTPAAKVLPTRVSHSGPEGEETTGGQPRAWHSADTHTHTHTHTHRHTDTRTHTHTQRNRW